MSGFDKVIPCCRHVGGVGVVGGFVDYEADVVEAGGVGEPVVKLVWLLATSLHGLCFPTPYGMVEWVLTS